MEISAKTNLFLHVGALRECDNRHEIRTLFLPVPQLADTVEISPSDNDALTIETAGRAVDCPPEDNLTLRAVKVFCEEFGLPQKWHLRLVKRIPVSAGLGGGSADAAAALLEMQRITGLGDEAVLARLAFSLGADVPYFLRSNTPAFGSGAGEVLTVTEIKIPYALVIVYPGTPSPVGWAYKHCQERSFDQPWPPVFRSIEDMANAMDNDLAPALMNKLPRLAMIQETMLKAGCLAATVSGSGSSMVGLAKPEDADQIRQNIRVATNLETW